MNNSTNYRPCEADGKKALFHRWTDVCTVVEPSPMVGGAPGGQVQRTFGLVEYADGTVEQILPHIIVFCDNLFKEYMFKEDSDDG